MKQKTFFLVIIGFLPVILGAQVIMSDKGIGIQGVLRNADNVALINKDVNINVVVALETGDELFKRENVPVQTNVNGVFIYKMALDNSFYASLTKNLGEDVRLKVLYEDEEVINTRLNPVPYAISSGNGVPVGAILPFAGDVLPYGFLACDGTSLKDENKYAKLRTLVGDKTPDLRGMFLRGAKAPGIENLRWPALKQFQEPSLLAHKHKIELSTSVDEQNLIDNSSPSDSFFPPALVDPSGYTHKIEWSGSIGVVGLYPFESSFLSVAPHLHYYRGATEADTETKLETRPYNYGVAYIIKY